MFSCNKEREATVELVYEINNNSQNIIIFSVTTDVGLKEIKLIKENKGELEFEKAETKKDDGGWTIYGGDGAPSNAFISISVLAECVYSITDTSYYCWNIGQKISNPIDSIYLNGIDVDINGTAWNVTKYIKVTISDSLLILMQKDYTMLDKFKEYYPEWD